MKEIKKLIFLGTCFIFFSILNTININALSGVINTRASLTNVVVGNNVNVTVTVSSSAPIGAWEFVLNYDSSKLRLVSSTPATYIVGYGDGVKKTASYTYTFKTLTAGSTSVSVKNALVLDFNTEAKLALSTSPANINIVKPTITVKSSNAYLSDLTVSAGTLDPLFNKKTTEYNVSIDELIDKLTIKATPEDSKASILGDGEVVLSEGKNTFEVKVTAEDGKTQIYTINIDVFDNNPINVTIGPKKYTVIKKGSVIDIPENYRETIIPIHALDVVAYTNEITKLCLVPLKDEQGKISLFIYNANKETYIPYHEFSTGILRLYIVENPKGITIPRNYRPTSITINDVKLKAWQSGEGNARDFYLIYGMNVNTGQYNFYRYDKVEETFQRFINKQQKSYQDIIQEYFIPVIIILFVLFSLIVIIIIQGIKIKKLRRSSIKAKKIPPMAQL